MFGVGGLPTGMGINDPPLRAMIFGAAAQLDGPQVLMLNKAQDEFFPAEDAHVFFSAIPGQRKRLVFWDGGHDDWPDEAIQHSVAFINEHT